MKQWLKSAVTRTLVRVRSAGFNPTSHGEKWVSAVGGFLGIFALLLINRQLLDLHGAAMLVASMGASAVLLFAVPHGALSQPWPVFGGHLISAFIGVSCAQWIDDPLVGAPLAVGTAIGVMHYLRCLHPPGGATALIAVVGGPAVEQLGYGFILSPVLENVIVILGVAVVVNLPFGHRRYPAFLSSAPEQKRGDDDEGFIAHSDLVYALSQLDSFIDVSEQDLMQIYRLALNHTGDAAGSEGGERRCMHAEAVIASKAKQAKYDPLPE